MVTIHNHMNQRLIINLTDGKNLHILAKGMATISEKDLGSRHLQTLIARGEIAVATGVKTEAQMNPKPKKETEIQPSLTEETAVQPDLRKETTVHPVAGKERKDRPNPAGKGESATSSKNGGANAKTASPVKVASSGSTKNKLILKEG